jgi:hypothetical protein
VLPTPGSFVDNHTTGRWPESRSGSFQIAFGGANPFGTEIFSLIVVSPLFGKRLGDECFARAHWSGEEDTHWYAAGASFPNALGNHQ